MEIFENSQLSEIDDFKNPALTTENNEVDKSKFNELDLQVKAEEIKIVRSVDFDNPLGLFEDESMDEPLSQKKDDDVEYDEEMFFDFEDKSQDMNNDEDSKLIDMDNSNAEPSESSNLDSPLVDNKKSNLHSWRGRRRFRGGKVPISVINKRNKRKVGEALANFEKVESKNGYQLFEYYWPPGKNAELCMTQEAVSEYLSVVSFKRKYPNLTRRSVEIKEREFLIEQFLVTEFQCELGLTILLADEVYDLMEEDFSQLYQEYLKKPRRRYRYIEKPLDPVLAEKLRKEQLMRKSVESASSYNSNLIKERIIQRKTYLDLQTFTIQIERRKQKVGINPYENLTNYYPVALVPKQFQHYYKKYTSQELNYLPINSALYTTHKKLTVHPDDYHDSDEELYSPPPPPPLPSSHEVHKVGNEVISKVEISASEIKIVDAINTNNIATGNKLTEYGLATGKIKAVKEEKENIKDLKCDDDNGVNDDDDDDDNNNDDANKSITKKKKVPTATLR